MSGSSERKAKEIVAQRIFKLTVFERMQVANLLPTENEVGILVKCRLAREALDFTEQELKTLNMQRVWLCNDCGHEKQHPLIDGEPGPCGKCEGRYVLTPRRIWDTKAAEKIGERDFALGEVLDGLITSRLRELSNKGKLMDSYVELYYKFVGKDD